MTAALPPDLFLKLFDPNNPGQPLAGGKVFTYIAGTSTKQATYTDSTQVTPNSNPIILNARGEAAMWMDPALTYKIVIAPANDTDPPTSPINTIDNVAGALTIAQLTQTLIGQVLYPRTAAEIAAGVTPVNYAYPAGYLERYGFSASASAAANSAAFITAANSGHALKLFTPGTYQTNGLITSKDFLDFEGAGLNLVTINVASGFNGLQLYGDVPPAFTHQNQGIHVRGMRFTQSDKTGVGLDLYSIARSQFGDLTFEGFNYGMRTRTCFPLSFYGMIRLTAGNIGWKMMPINGSDSLGTNSISADMLDVRVNVFAGISLAGGSAIDIQTLLGEGNPVVGYIKEGVQCLSIGAVYVEPGSAVSSANRRKNRAGVLTPFTWIMGADEAGVSSGVIVENGNTADPSRLLRLGREVDSFGGSPSYVSNVDGVKWDMTASRGYVILGHNVKGYEADTIQGDDALASSIVAGIGRNFSSNVLRRWVHNLIPNGNFVYPSLPVHTFATAVNAYQTLNGNQKRCMTVTLPNASLTVTGSFFARLAGGMFSSSVEQVYAEIHCQATSTDIASVRIELRDNNSNIIAAKTLTANFTSWQVISCADSINKFLTPNVGIEVRVIVTRTTGTGAQSLYIDEIVCAPTRSGVLQQGPQDLVTGHRFSGTCTVLDTGRYYVEFDSGLGDPSYFDVIASSQGTAAGGDISVIKLGGGNAGKFRVYSATNGMVVSALVIPLVGVIP